MGSCGNSPPWPRRMLTRSPGQPSLRRALTGSNVIRPHPGALQALHLIPGHGTGVNWHLPENPGGVVMAAG